MDISTLYLKTANEFIKRVVCWLSCKNLTGLTISNEEVYSNDDFFVRFSVKENQAEIRVYTNKSYFEIYADTNNINKSIEEMVEKKIGATSADVFYVAAELAKHWEDISLKINSLILSHRKNLNNEFSNNKAKAAYENIASAIKKMPKG